MMSLRQKIILSAGALLLGLVLLTCGGSLRTRLAGGFMALDGLFLLGLWSRCPECGRRLDWGERRMFCPHCGAWIDYDRK